MAFTRTRLRALTLDLDDTLWPVMPALARAEEALRDWLERHAPGLRGRCDAETVRTLRADVARELPALAHDLSAMRLETIRRLLATAGEDEALAARAFEVFFAERQRVTLYADVLPGLERLAARWPLLALSNGNADIGRIGIGRWFVGSLGAREIGVPKPDARAFAAACARLGCRADEVLHVGDDLVLDVRGARAAGLGAAWLRRGEGSAVADDGGACWQGADLLALADWLGT